MTNSFISIKLNKKGDGNRENLPLTSKVSASKFETGDPPHDQFVTDRTNVRVERELFAVKKSEQ